MPSWNDLLQQSKSVGSVQDVVRRHQLVRVHEFTKRNVIVCYSGWLRKGHVAGVEINDEDKNGFMTVVHQMDRSLGLDLLLHTPGGDTAATESLVDYLRSMFGTDIRAIVPLEADYAAVRRARARVTRLLAEWERGGRQRLCPVPDEPLPPIGTLRTLIAAEQDRGPDFLRLANALSALYPRGSQEKRLLDAMLLAVPR